MHAPCPPPKKTEHLKILKTPNQDESRTAFKPLCLHPSMHQVPPSVPPVAHICMSAYSSWMYLIQELSNWCQDPWHLTVRPCLGSPQSCGDCGSPALPKGPCLPGSKSQSPATNRWSSWTLAEVWPAMCSTHSRPARAMWSFWICKGLKTAIT